MTSGDSAERRPEEDREDLASGSTSARHRAREVALQVLFALDVQAHPGRNRSNAAIPDFETVFADVAAHFEMPDAVRTFARRVAEGALSERAVVDGTISEHARNWRLDRMALVDRNILRLATWELLRSDTPAPVILDEAIELTHRFAADASPAFVNGILDAVAKAVRSDAGGAASGGNPR